MKTKEADLIKKILEKIWWDSILKAFAIILFLFIFVGFVNKHISYTLIEGSIFEPMRDYFAHGIIENEGFKKIAFSKLNELFGCNHCMTYQVGLWSTMFLIVISYHFWPTKFKTLKWKRKTIYFLTLWFALGTFNAASGYKWWSWLEYENQKIALQISQNSGKYNNSDNTPKIEIKNYGIAMNVSLAKFRDIFTQAENKCDYSCPIMKRECRNRILKEAGARIAKKRSLKIKTIERKKMVNALATVANTYPKLLSPARSMVEKEAFALFKKTLEK